MNTRSDLSQLLLRLSLGTGFLLAVLDRVGWLGEPGANGNAWGNWKNFVAYTHSLMPYLGSSMTSVMAALATVMEIVLGLALIFGFRTKMAALGSCLLTLCFGLSMFFFSDFRAPFSYSVFSISAASLLLATLPKYRWSVDRAEASPASKFAS